MGLATRLVIGNHQGSHTHHQVAYQNDGLQRFHTFTATYKYSLGEKRYTPYSSEFKATNPRMETVRNIGRRLLELPENVAFNSFSDEIVSILRSNFQQTGRCRSGATKREHLWREFHKQSLEILPAKWKKLYTNLTPLVGKAEQLLYQTVNVVVYEQLLLLVGLSNPERALYKNCN